MLRLGLLFMGLKVVTIFRGSDAKRVAVVAKGTCASCCHFLDVSCVLRTGSGTPFEFGRDGPLRRHETTASLAGS